MPALYYSADKSVACHEYLQKLRCFNSDNCQKFKIYDFSILVTKLNQENL